MRLISVVLITIFGYYACSSGAGSTTVPTSANTQTGGGNAAVPARQAEAQEQPAAADEPKTVREFFMALPDKYFTLEGCDRASDKGCKKAKAEYLKSFTQVLDIKNGYLKGGCDGAQSCIEMAIFRRPDGRYLVGLATSGEMINEFNFLDYSGGKWTDASGEVPAFSKTNWYELPRVGTTLKVFEKKITEKGSDYEISERGRKLYDLVWKEGKFRKE